MNIKKAKQEVKDAIAAYLEKDEFGAYAIPAIRQRPILLIGPPGVGKTQIMEQISQECQIGLVAYTITHHTRQSAIGLPFIEHRVYGGREYAVTEYTMSEIVASVYHKIEQTGLREGILFIDEINCVSETLAPTMLQFLQGKTFGNHRIPEGWIIVAAGNPPEYNKSVREFDIVTLDRIRRIDVEPDYEVWKEYAVQVDIHPAIRSYLDIRRQHFCRIETTVDGRLFATPRGWEDLSELIRIYEKLGKRVDRDVVAEYIQFPKIAKDFANYLELYDKYQNDYQVKEILEGHFSEAMVDKLEKAAFDERISVVGLLLSGLNEGFRQVCHLCERLTDRQACLSKLKENGAFAGDVAQVLSAFEEMEIGYRAEWEKKREAGLLSRTALRRNRAVSAKLEEDLGEVKKQDFSGAAAVWEFLRGRFMADSEQYEALIDETGERLEHVFDFMEAAFGAGQEMVLFVTELNTGFYSVRFLQEYECERYYEYNRNLLFSEEERAIGELLK
ncbi:MAG: AAA family ATPase [Clostridiales bacterium]|nr:AAA family ATPase [Clostridiales bacterium]